MYIIQKFGYSIHQEYYKGFLDYIKKKINIYILTYNFKIVGKSNLLGTIFSGKNFTVVNQLWEKCLSTTCLYNITIY